MNTLKDVGVAAVVSVLIAGGVAVAGSTAGDSDDDLVRARFVSAAPLVEGNQVKIDGVVVGTVEGLAVKDGVAEVSMDLDDAARPLHQDARLTIRPVSLLGERYVDLDRGSPDARVLDAGAVIPVSQTATSVGLDQVLNTVDDPTGDGLRALITTLGEGMQDNGGNVDAALKALSPSLRDTSELARVLSQHNQLLARLVKNFEPVSGALAVREGRAMDKLVASSDVVLGTVRRRQRELDRTLTRMPSTLRTLRATLRHLRETAGASAPTLAQLRPLMDNLPAVAGELRQFSDALDPALASSQPVLDQAATLLREAAPVAAAARESGPDLARTTSGLRRVSAELTKNREHLFAYVRYWALTTNGFDGLSHYFRVNATVNPAMLTGLLSDSSPQTPTVPDVGDPDQGPDQGPDLGDVLPPVDPGGDLSGILGQSSDGQLVDDLLTGGLLRTSARNGESPTGLSPQQESELLGMLLGGQ